MTTCPGGAARAALAMKVDTVAVIGSPKPETPRREISRV